MRGWGLSRRRRFKKLSKRGNPGRKLKKRKGLPLIVIETDQTNPIFCLVDSGSEVSIIEEDALIGQVNYIRNNLAVNSIKGEPLNIVGQLDINTGSDNLDFESHRFLIQKDPLPKFQGILGNDWLIKNNAIVNFKDSVVEVNSKRIPFVRTVKMKRWFGLSDFVK